MSIEYKRYQEGLIRSILARPDEISSVVTYIDSKDFNDVNLKLVYESVLNIHLMGGQISLPEIALEIGNAGGAVDTAWLFGLNSNMAQWIQAAPPETWARLLKKESAKYKARVALQEALKDLEKKEINPLSVMDKTSNILSEISVNTVSGDIFDINTAVDNFEVETKEIIKSGGRVSSINSAYPTIDYYTHGWGATHLITIGARTAVGKSVFAINNAVAAMMQDKTVLFFSLEMSEREVLSRMIAQLAMIPIQKIEKAQPLTADEIKRQKEALEIIRNSKLKIDTNPHVTVEYLKRAAIRQAQSEDGLDFIIIDYLQLIANEGKNNRQEAVADVSRNMKILAKELNVPVMVLVQLNREKGDGGDEDNTPKIFHIRESGAIAQDSNVVILLDRKMDGDEDTLDPKATFIIAKNRQGESNKYITVRTRLECSLFIDDNIKGQELMKDLELSVEKYGDYEEVNYDSSEYKNSIDFEGLEEITDDELANLFNDNDDFASFSDDLMLQGGDF